MEESHWRITSLGTELEPVRPLVIASSPSNTVHDLKACIFDTFGVPPEYQQLRSCGRVLYDHESLPNNKQVDLRYHGLIGGRECVTGYPEGYNFRCCCFEVGMDDCTSHVKVIACYSCFLRLDLDCCNAGFDQSCAKQQLCCLGCTIDNSKCCLLSCNKEKDCMCCPESPQDSPVAVQCCCLHTGFLIKDCSELDCCKLKLCCIKSEVDSNFNSCQLCCCKCGDEEVRALPQTLVA